VVIKHFGKHQHNTTSMNYSTVSPAYKEHYVITDSVENVPLKKQTERFLIDDFEISDVAVKLPDLVSYSDGLWFNSKP
jgi:hypothetical protein